MTTHKRWIALLMALCLMLPGLQALAEEAPPEEPRIALDSILYYLSHEQPTAPPEGTISLEEAVEQAWILFLDGGPERLREQMRVVSAVFHHWPQEDRSWWMIKIMPKGASDDGPAWYAALLAPGGDLAISSDRIGFEREIDQQRRQEQMAALVAERGPFEIWDLEQKVETYPFVYREPKEGDLPQAEAMGLAREAIKKHLFASDEALDGLKLVVSLTTENVWRVEYYEHELKDGQAVCRYAVALNSLTGEVIEVIADAPIGNG